MQKRAFTLVELLVVIAIISILAALLLPALQKAVTQAHLTACVSGKRQIYLGMTYYNTEFDNYMLSPMYGATVAHCATSFRKQAMNLGVLLWLRYTESPKLLYCTDHSESETFYQKSNPTLTRLMNEGNPPIATTPNSNYCMNTTTIMAGPSGIFTDRKVVYPNQITGSGVLWWNKVNQPYPYTEGITCKLSGNLPGGKLYWGDPNVIVRKIRSPRCLAACALSRGWSSPWKDFDTLRVHDNTGFAALYADGVVKAVRMPPSHPLYAGFFRNGGGWNVGTFPKADRMYPGYEPPR